MQKRKGFTLIELLVVIAILGILSTLAVVSLQNARSKARDARRVADIKQIQTALELYYNDNNHYPHEPTEIDLGTANTALSENNGFAAGAGTNPGTVYMTSVPAAPVPADGSCSATQNGYSYTSYTSSAGTPTSADESSSYAITYCLGADTGGVAAGVHSATPGGISD